jgi:hypothetical protein
MTRAFLLAAACIGLAGCNAGGGAPNANLPAMNVAFTWCSGTPAFTIGNIPATAKMLSFRMIDQQAPGYNHGGGTVPASGKATQTIIVRRLERLLHRAGTCRRLRSMTINGRSRLWMPADSPSRQAGRPEKFPE